MMGIWRDGNLATPYWERHANTGHVGVSLSSGGRAAEAAASKEGHSASLDLDGTKARVRFCLKTRTRLFCLREVAEAC